MLTSPSASSGVEAATADMGNIPTTKEKLAALLEGEAKALLLRLIDADSEISNTLALENFIQGFRLGMRLAMEGLDEAEGVDRA